MADPANHFIWQKVENPSLDAIEFLDTHVWIKNPP